MVVVITAANVAAVMALPYVTNDGPLGLAVGITGMSAFVGMLVLSQETDGTWRITESAMRTAIASTMVAVYIALISMTTFHPGKVPVGDVTKSLLSSFTTTVGVVMAFYFGASAYVEGRRITANRQ